MKNHYAVASTHPMWALDRLDAAYTLAGLNPPSLGNPCADLLAEQLTASQVATELARESLTTTDPARWLTSAQERIARAHAVDALKDALAQDRVPVIEEALPAMREQAALELRPAFKRTVKMLTAAAKALPQGDAPLDLEAVVALDVTKEMKHAQQALADLATLAAIVPTVSGIDGVPAPALPVLAVVDLPEVEPEEVDSFGRPFTFVSGTRGKVRSLLFACERPGVDRALIGLARGDYGKDISFNLAASAEEVRARAERAATAFRRVRAQSRVIRVLS